MTEERKQAILFAATLLVARKLMPLLDRDDCGRTAPTDYELLHYEERAIYQASRILDKIDQRWPTKEIARSTGQEEHSH